MQYKKCTYTQGNNFSKSYKGSAQTTGQWAMQMISIAVGVSTLLDHPILHVLVLIIGQQLYVHCTTTAWRLKNH